MNNLFRFAFIFFLLIFFSLSCSRSGRKKRLENISRSSGSDVSGDSRQKDDRKVIIQLKEKSGVYILPVKINGIEIEFILDTGASFISISSSALRKLIESNVISQDDVTGNTSFIDATGDVSNATTVNLKKIELGDIIQRNVDAAIIESENADCLLGQSFLRRFGKVSFDYENKLLILEV